VFNAIARSTTIVNAIGAGDGSLLIPMSCSNAIYGNVNGVTTMWIDAGQYFSIDRGTANEEIVQTGCACNSAIPNSTVYINVTNCAGKRGALGTIARAHAAGATFERLFLRPADAFVMSKESGQYDQSTGASSIAYDITVPDSVTGKPLTGARAFEVMQGLQPYRNWNSDTGCSTVSSNAARNCMNWMWSIIPPHTIDDVQVLAATTSALLTWTAPDTNACRVGVGGSAFSSSDDTGDTTVASGPAARTYSASGLASGTSYFYRITCGPGGGTARASGTFSTK
jgi:hypothetical protein